jgi:hypothetical protein
MWIRIRILAPKIKAQNLKYYSVHFGLLSANYADSDPDYHVHVDADPDPTFLFDVDPRGSGSTTLIAIMVSKNFPEDNRLQARVQRFQKQKLYGGKSFKWVALNKFSLQFFFIRGPSQFLLF